MPELVGLLVLEIDLYCRVLERAKADHRYGGVGLSRLSGANGQGGLFAAYTYDRGTDSIRPAGSLYYVDAEGHVAPSSGLLKVRAFVTMGSERVVLRARSALGRHYGARYRVDEVESVLASLMSEPPMERWEGATVEYEVIPA